MNKDCKLKITAVPDKTDIEANGTRNELLSLTVQIVLAVLKETHDNKNEMYMSLVSIIQALLMFSPNND